MPVNKTETPRDPHFTGKLTRKRGEAPTLRHNPTGSFSQQLGERGAWADYQARFLPPAPHGCRCGTGRPPRPKWGSVWQPVSRTHPATRRHSPRQPRPQATPPRGLPQRPKSRRHCEPSGRPRPCRAGRGPPASPNSQAEPATRGKRAQRP